MAIKSEISWKRKDPEGNRVEVYARRHGGRWTFHFRAKRYDLWQRLEPVPLEDWLSLLEAVRRRIPRRLYPPEEVNRISEEIRRLFPEADLPES